MMLLPVGRMYIRMESAMSIIVDKISYVYEAGTGFERRALDNVSCAINDGEFVGLIGHTGSGKSTFIQHLNGLLKATEGHIYFNGQDIYDAGFNMKELRSKVGLVFRLLAAVFCLLHSAHSSCGGPGKGHGGADHGGGAGCYGHWLTSLAVSTVAGARDAPGWGVRVLCQMVSVGRAPRRR